MMDELRTVTGPGHTRGPPASSPRPDCIRGAQTRSELAGGNYGSCNPFFVRDNASFGSALNLLPYGPKALGPAKPAPGQFQKLQVFQRYNHSFLRGYWRQKVAA